MQGPIDNEAVIEEQGGAERFAFGFDTGGEAASSLVARLGRNGRFQPWMFLLGGAVAITVSETLIAILLTYLPPHTHLQENLIDAAMLFTLLVFTYWFFYRPIWGATQRAQLEIQHLSRELMRAEEVERRRLARDLHDEIGQTLTGLQLGLSALRFALPERGQECEHQFTKLSGLVAELSDRVRDTTSSLHPALLDDMGLVPTLQWYVNRFSAHIPGGGVTFHPPARNRRLPPEVETVLYRICQEALANVSRHARAREVNVHLELLPNRAVITVVDDGAGFDPKRLSGSDGIGLICMRERLAALGGELKIQSRPGQGTTIAATVLLTREGWSE